MKLLALLLAVLLVGCEDRTVKFNPPASATEVTELREKLKASNAERDELRAKLAAAEAKPAAEPVDSKRDQMLAVGRYLLQEQKRRLAIGMGGMSDSELAKYKPWLVKLAKGESITAEEFVELDRVMNRSRGAIPDQLEANVDWSTNPELKKMDDELSLMVNKEAANAYAIRLNRATSSDDKAMMVFEREMEVLGSDKVDKIIQ